MNFEINLQFSKNIFVHFQTIYIYILFTDILIKKWQEKTLEFPLEIKGAIKFSGLQSPLDKTQPQNLSTNSSIQLCFNEHLSPPFLFRYF